MGHARDPSSRARGEEGRGRKSTRVHTHTNTACVWHTAAMTLYTIALDGETSSNTVKTLLCEFQRHHVLESSRAGRGGGQTACARTHAHAHTHKHAQIRTHTNTNTHSRTRTHSRTSTWQILTVVTEVLRCVESQERQREHGNGVHDKVPHCSHGNLGVAANQTATNNKPNQQHPLM